VASGERREQSRSQLGEPWRPCISAASYLLAYLPNATRTVEKAPRKTYPSIAACWCSAVQCNLAHCQSCYQGLECIYVFGLVSHATPSVRPHGCKVGWGCRWGCRPRRGITQAAVHYIHIMCSQPQSASKAACTHPNSTTAHIAVSGVRAGTTAAPCELAKKGRKEG
jgi:hypothetical protein